MWERFSFYGMQGILVIYLYYSASQGGLGIDEGTATGIVGAYGGAVYLATILGAWVADRLVGPERTLFASAIVVMAGHIALALIPDLAGVAVGLSLVALGSGGVKANATSLVGSLYAEDDERRDAGFSLFYMGINIGAFAGPLLTGLLQENQGFHYGFGLAAVGMALGLVQYAVGRRSLPDETHDVPHPLEPSGRLKYAAAGVGFAAVVAVLAVTGLLNAGNLANWVLGVVSVAAVAYFVVILASSEISDTERSRVWSFVPLFVCNAVFWSLYQQQFTVVEIFSDKRLDRDLFGWEMPVSWVNSINPVFVIVLAGAFAAMWTRLGTPAGDAGQVRSRHGGDGSRLLAVPPQSGRREHRSAAPAGRDPAGLHHRRAADLTGGTLAVDQAGAGAVPYPDGGALLPLGRLRDRDGGQARGVLRHGRRDAATSSSSVRSRWPRAGGARADQADHELMAGVR